MPDDREAAGVVAPQWRQWVTENLARGASEDELRAALVEAGVPEGPAQECVASLASSPALAHARDLARRVAALEEIVRLRREHRRARPGGSTVVERGPLPPADEFLERFWVPGVPAIFTDLVTRWPAFGRWGLRDFAERFGDCPIEACVGRASCPDPDVRWKELRRSLTMAEFIELLETAPANDAYVTTNNRALRNPQLRPLLDELWLPPELFGSTLDPTRMGLWIGAAGTHTATHHDQANSMVGQVLGRKRFRLVPPESLELLERSRGVFNHWDPRDGQAPPDEAPAGAIEFVLEAGEALFLPAGWWHHVDGLETAISVSIRFFAWPNDYGWYRPGTALAGRS